MTSFDEILSTIADARNCLLRVKDDLDDLDCSLEQTEHDVRTLAEENQ